LAGRMNVEILSHKEAARKAGDELKLTKTGLEQAQHQLAELQADYARQGDYFNERAQEFTDKLTRKNEEVKSKLEQKLAEVTDKYEKLQTEHKSLRRKHKTLEYNQAQGLVSRSPGAGTPPIAEHHQLHVPQPTGLVFPGPPLQSSPDLVSPCDERPAGTTEVQDVLAAPRRETPQYFKTGTDSESDSSDSESGSFTSCSNSSQNSQSASQVAPNVAPVGAVPRVTTPSSTTSITSQSVAQL